MKNRKELDRQLHKPPSYSLPINNTHLLFHFPPKISFFSLSLSLSSKGRRRRSSPLRCSQHAFHKARWFSNVPPTGYLISFFSYQIHSFTYWVFFFFLHIYIYSSKNFDVDCLIKFCSSFDGSWIFCLGFSGKPSYSWGNSCSCFGFVFYWWSRIVGQWECYYLN